MKTRLFAFVFLAIAAAQFAAAQGPPSAGLSSAEVAAAAEIGQQISTSEWLGPLAPIALSPFFGMACLAGLAQFGPESLVASNGFLSAESPLHQPAVFWTFAVLAAVTSLPRLTKVSKPISGALEQLESYSSIIAIVAIRYLAGQGEAVPSEADVVYVAGLGSMTVDAVLSIAAAVNIVVINGVKFFFEFLIWLVPIPTLDALFEAANKACVAGLMGLYAWSPLLGTLFNAFLFTICAVVFIWTRRQVVFLRTMLVGWLWGLIVKGKPPSAPEVVVFPKDDLGPFAARERLILSRDDEGITLTKKGFFGGETAHRVTPSRSARIDPGWLTHSIVLVDDPEHPDLLLSRHQTRHLDVIAALLHIRLVEEDAEAPKAAAADQIGPLKPKPRPAT